MKKNSSVITFLFWVHIVIVAVLFGLLLIPKVVWEEVAVFHLWYVVSILSLELLWGLVMFYYSKRMDIVCFLTSIMQYLRGYKLSDRRNYDHSFIAEFLEKMGFRVSYRSVNVVLLLLLCVVSIRYFNS